MYPRKIAKQMVDIFEGVVALRNIELSKQEDRERSMVIAKIYLEKTFGNREEYRAEPLSLSYFNMIVMNS
ncbi:hypothetical protein ACFQ3N_10635 [Virgibacillus byunsanensis]|uniref:Uncharacterized protein n=1 Tax=Virgibacillus byunsanensis TaxID=570945 RepID=A0ABW3LMB8_9BACI